MKRKTIAICMNGYNWNFESLIVDGARQRCKELGYDLLLFNPLIRRPDRNSWQKLHEHIVSGENEIFELINFSMLDGIIIEGDSFIRHATAERIAERAAEAGVPLINAADPFSKSRFNVTLSDRDAMGYVVEHLITEHDCRRIAFIGGFQDNVQTEERLGAYKSALEKHGIPFREDYVRYGNFWKPAYERTGELLDLAEPPEAIVCANDTMAFFTIDCIRDRGLRVPEDIIVTGFDGIEDSQSHNPSLTTVRHAYAAAGAVCVDQLTRIWAGESVKNTEEVMSELLLGQSCGCLPMKEKDDVFVEFMEFRTKSLEFNNYLIEMNNSFSSADTSEEMYLDCKRGADYFGLKEFFICICDTVENEVGNIDAGDNFLGISDNLRIMYDAGGRYPAGTVFSRERMLPFDLSEREEPVFLTLVPMHFKNRSLGYVIYERDSVEMSGDLFVNWIMAICNNAGSFYMRNQLEFLVKKLENLYVRDPMTELFNRRGMLRFGGELIEEALRKRRTITVFSVDIDNLKPINDNFGHLGGDNAICQAGSALFHAMPQGSIVARTGGDEFCAICSGLEPGTEQGYLDKIDKLLADHDKTSGMPYTVGVSGGFCTVDHSRFDSLDTLMKLADMEMYKVKLAKKTVRL